jgi:hypothetical protein
VPADLKDKFKEALVENTTFTVQNFVVDKNNIALKCSDHPFKLVFNSSTLIEDMNQHIIPHPGYKFQDFDDIKAGKVRPDLCVGSFSKLYIQSLFCLKMLQLVTY